MNDEAGGPIEQQIGYVSEYSDLMLAVGAGGLAVILLFATTRLSSTRKKRVKPQYRRAALIRSIGGIHSTSRRKILTFDTCADFLVSVNVTKPPLLSTMLPLFERKRSL